MSRDEQGTGIARIERAARQAERRIRGVRALRVLGVALCAALGVAILDVALRKLGVLGELPARLVLGGAVGAVTVSGVVAWVSRLPERAGARALDRFHGWHDRLASALAFAGQPPAERTPFMEAAIDDAIAIVPAARPSGAVPIVVPRSLGAVAVLAGVWLGVMRFEVRTHLVVAHAPLIDPVEMAPDDLEDVKDFLKAIDRREGADDIRRTIEEFNQLVDDIASRRLDRTEALRRMEALDHQLDTDRAVDRKVLEPSIEAMGDEMKKADWTRPAGIALSDHDLAKARDALHELARKVRTPAGAVDKSKLDQMRAAIEKAVQKAQEARAELARRREQLADEILKRKQNGGDAGADEEQSLLKKKQAELDRLDRDLNEQQSARQQLDRLDRELQKAAEDLMKDLGLGAQDLDQSAEDLNQMNQQQMSQAEKEELRQKLQEMRDLLRQGGQGGGSRVVRLTRFARMARGQSGPGGPGGSGTGGAGQGQGGQGTSGPGQPMSKGGGPGQPGQPGQGQGQGQGGGSQGAGQGGETWIVGPNGEKVLMMSEAQTGSGAGMGHDTGGQGQNGEGTPGRWGEGHDPNLQGKATHPNMTTVDTQVSGTDSVQGGSRSQVILGAAERGFASRDYRTVFTEYHQVAEESLAKDDIPGGYRFYVKRYFQLIRPRETP